MKKLIKNNPLQYLTTILAFITILLCGSCEEEGVKKVCGGGYTAILNVYVTGTLSGNPRDNISVGLYYSKSDAENEKKVIEFGVTDFQGNVEFECLNPGTRYWVRAEALLSKKIKETQTLKSGYNEFNISIL